MIELEAAKPEKEKLALDVMLNSSKGTTKALDLMTHNYTGRQSFTDLHLSESKSRIVFGTKNEEEGGIILVADD